MNWKLQLFTHFLAACGGGAIVYIFYSKIISAYNAADSGVKAAVVKFHKVKSAL